MIDDKAAMLQVIGELDAQKGAKPHTPNYAEIDAFTNGVKRNCGSVISIFGVIAVLMGGCVTSGVIGDCVLRREKTGEKNSPLVIRPSMNKEEAALVLGTAIVPLAGIGLIIWGGRMGR